MLPQKYIRADQILSRRRKLIERIRALTVISTLKPTIAILHSELKATIATICVPSSTLLDDVRRAYQEKIALQWLLDFFKIHHNNLVEIVSIRRKSIYDTQRLLLSYSCWYWHTSYRHSHSYWFALTHHVECLDLAIVSVRQRNSRQVATSTSHISMSSTATIYVLAKFDNGRSLLLYLMLLINLHLLHPLFRKLKPMVELAIKNYVSIIFLIIELLL